MEDNQTKSVALRLLAIGVWCALVGLVIYAIREIGPASTTGEDSIARFVSAVGNVRIQADESVRWRKAIKKQLLHEGDRVATGKKSGATIAFDAGRAIRVGEDSLIVISSIKQGSDFNFIVDVRKGSVIGATSATKKIRAGNLAPLPIQLRNGNKTFSVDPGKIVGVVKPIGGSVRVVSETTLKKSESVKSIASIIDKIPALKMQEVNLSGVSNAAQGLTGIKSSLSDQPTQSGFLDPTVEAKKKIEANAQPGTFKKTSGHTSTAKDFLPAIADPSDGTLFWSFKSIQEMSQLPLSFVVVPPPRSLKDLAWRPLIEVGATGSGEHSDGLVLTGSGFKTQTIETSFGLLAKRGLVTSLDGIPMVTINYRPGAIIKLQARPGDADSKSSAATERSFARTSRSLRVLAIGDVITGPISFSVNVLSNDKTPVPNGFVEPKPPVSASVPFLTVRLASAGDLKDLHGFIRGATAVEFSRSDISDGNGLYVVRSQKVIAQLVGTLVPEKDAISELLSSLRADFIFRGDKKAFVDANSRGGKTLKEIASSMIQKNQVFYVMSAKDLVAVNRDFVSRNGDVARFIEDNASVIFTSQVEVLESR